jgi:hypothetical protein
MVRFTEFSTGKPAPHKIDWFGGSAVGLRINGAEVAGKNDSP